MTDTAWSFDETVVPTDEAALIEALLNEVSGPVMSPDEVKAWLEQQGWLAD